MNNTYETLPDPTVVDAAITGLKTNGFDAHREETGADALAWIKKTVPAGASVFNGTSRTLEQIGLVDWLKSGQHGWVNRHEEILKETDPAKQLRLRKEAGIADWYFGSVHALSEDGQLVIASASGSQLPSIVFDATNLILVASTKKVAKTLGDALDRLESHVVPQEDERMKGTGAPGTVLSKVLIYKSHPGWGRTIHIVLVNENLGF